MHTVIHMHRYIDARVLPEIEMNRTTDHLLKKNLSVEIIGKNVISISDQGTTLLISQNQ